MIFTYQIVDGFETLIGPETLHFPMLVTLLWQMGYPEITDPEEHYLHARKLYWISLLYHGLAALHLLTKRHGYAWSSNLSQYLILLVIGQVYLTINAMVIVFSTTKDETDESTELTEARRRW